MSRALVVSLHDACPATLQACRTIRAALRAEGVGRAVLKVIPCAAGGDCDADPAFADWLRRCLGEGDELVQHGLCHVGPLLDGEDRRGLVRPPPWLCFLDTVVVRGIGEFLWLDRAEALRRLAEGRQRLANLGLRAAGFTAPGWLYSPAAAEAVAEMGFTYLTTVCRVRDLRPGGRDHWGVGMCNRPGEYGLDLFSRGVTECLVAVQAQAPLVRLSFHPADIEGHQPFTHTLGKVREALAAGRSATTYAEYLDRAGCRG
ncbi:MAG: DUF2334 domain-containing protein [Armatimonadetes bacterium]|nr:DUF2334 domain-containing protein [Armatimonadota bacterium]